MNLDNTFHCTEVVLPSFDALNASVKWEFVGNGRWIALVVTPDEQGRVPLVRSTQKCSMATQIASPLHHCVCNAISQTTHAHYNNLMFEKYSGDYTKMGWHSDCDLDLEPGSQIAIVSTYHSVGTPRVVTPRVLGIKLKNCSAQQELVMQPNHVIWFDTLANGNYLHRITANTSDTPTWIGITCRQSKTWMTPMQLQYTPTSKQFYALRHQQNKWIGQFSWPSMDHTISLGDTLPLLPAPIP